MRTIAALVARLERSSLAGALRSEIIIAKLSAGLAGEARIIEARRHADGMWRI